MDEFLENKKYVNVAHTLDCRAQGSGADPGSWQSARR